MSFFVCHCGLTAEVNQSRGVSPHTRPKGEKRLFPFWKSPGVPREVTCIDQWLRAYSKIANASDGSALHPCKAPQFGSPCLSLISAKITDFHSPLPPESYADVLSASRDFLQRSSATSQGKVYSCELCVVCEFFKEKEIACPIFLKAFTQQRVLMQRYKRDIGIKSYFLSLGSRIEVNIYMD